MAVETVDSSVRLSDVGRVIRRHLPLFIAVVALTLLGSVAYGIAAPKEYTSTATLVVSPITTNPFSSTAPTQTININTEREILASSEVARIASESLGQEISANSTLLNQVDVAAPTGSQILQVSVSSPTPDEAAESANAMANAYLVFRAEGATEVAVSFIAAIDEQLAELQGTDDASSRESIASLQEQRASLAIVGDNPGRLIGGAIPPTSPSSLGMPVYLVAGLVGGLILALIAVLVWDRANPRVAYRERLELLTGQEPLAVRSPADIEGFRWVLRAIDRASSAADAPSRTPSVAVFSADGKDAATVIQALAAVAVSDGRPVVMYFADDFDADDLSWGWPSADEFAELGGDLVLIDATKVHSGARRATLADRVTMSVVVATKRSRIGFVRELTEELSRSATSAVLSLFMMRSGPSTAPPSTQSLPPRDGGESDDDVPSHPDVEVSPRAASSREASTDQHPSEIIASGRDSRTGSPASDLAARKASTVNSPSKNRSTGSNRKPTVSRNGSTARVTRRED